MEIGAFSALSSVDNVINFNLFILAHIVTALVAGVLFEELREHKTILQKKVTEAIAENEKQQLMLLQQNRLAQMGEMIAMIAHQWRQPLNNLSLSNQLLVSKYNKGKLDASVVENFKKDSKKQINQMSTTIEDFMNFFKPQKEKKEFCINVLIHKVVDLNYIAYQKSDVFINCTSTEQVSTLGFKNELGQAILNILNNAKDALLESEQEVKTIDINVAKKDAFVIISIEYNAGGIDETIMDKIFDPYFSTKQEKNGTGLGLYMTKMLIEQEDEAKIEVENTNKGARFEITLKGAGKCL
jgi:signal transduction histidine kinase